MERQIIQRAQQQVAQRAGALPGLYRAGAFIYRNRAELANAMRNGARVARRVYNRFASRGSSASSSSRSSVVSNFKPAYPPGGGGGGTRRFRRSKRGGRKYFRGSGRRYRRPASGVYTSILKTLFPLRKAMGTAHWNASTGIGTVGVTSMEVGTYDSGGFSAGLGPQSTFAQYGTNSGSINTVINQGSTMPANTKRYFLPQRLVMNIQNASNSPVYIDFYLCKWRRSEGTGGELRLKEKFLANCTSAGVNLWPGITPFQVNTFVNQIKILRKWKVKLGQGESTMATCVSPIKGSLTFEAVTDECVTPRWTRGILMLFHGIPVHDTTVHSAVNTGPSSINIIAKTFVSHRLTSAVSQVPWIQTFPGTVNTAEIPVGNSNNPTAFAY